MKGDVKLFTAIGCTFGFHLILWIFLYSIFLVILKDFHWRKVDRFTTFPFVPFFLLGPLITNTFVYLGLV